MNLPFLFARRYLFSKRSTNAINIITGIAVGGIAIGTAALVLVLSVFNGFEDLLGGLLGYFDPPVKITPAKGKTFVVDSTLLARLRQTPGVLLVSETLEEVAFFEYEGAQSSGMLKGVDPYFSQINNIDTTIQEGTFTLELEDRAGMVLGAGVRNRLSINVNNPLASLTVYMADASGGALDKPFKTRYAVPTGTFAIQQDFDNEYVLSGLDFARELLEAPEGSVSALEISYEPGANVGQVKTALREVMGEGFVVRDRYEQNEAFFKVMQLEKWMGFAITSLMLLLMAFNLIGALWMIVLDKQKDISMLKSMGAEDGIIRRIFLGEGLLLASLGMFIGLVLALAIYAAQKQFGLVRIPQGFLVDTYPIALRWYDLIPVALTVLFIGLLAALAPAARAVRVPAFLREE
jgi:lipoprotein-releasing system permease protein